MLVKLIAKYTTWTQEKSDSFHNHAIRGNLDGEYIWESDNNGFYIYRSAGCYYCSNEGIVYTLSQWTTTYDWESHLKLYDHLKTSNCRIDVPLDYQELILDDRKFYYRVFKRPNKEYGKDYHLDIFDGKVNDQYFLRFIDDTNELLQELKILYYDKNVLLPKLGLTVFKRMFDSKGHFWIDFKYWEVNFNEFINITLKSLDTVIFYLEYNKLGVYNKELIIGTAKEKWITT